MLFILWKSENHLVITTETCHKLPPPSTVDTIFHADDVMPDVKASIVMLERQECLLQLRIKELESSENILHQRVTFFDVDWLTRPVVVAMAVFVRDVEYNNMVCVTAILSMY